MLRLIKESESAILTPEGEAFRANKVIRDIQGHKTMIF